MEYTKKINFSILLSITVFISLNGFCADPPSHDPCKIVKEGNRYYVFTTGDGIWNCSSTDIKFQTFKTENLVFPKGTWPDWINSYVPGFAGTFWAPGIIFMNNKWHIYYSCSTFGSQTSAIGVVTTPSLATRQWSDQGMVVYSKNTSLPYSINAIDPDVFRDTSDRVWLIYGSFWDGIVMTEIDTTTGKPIEKTNITHVANQSCEAGGMMFYEGYYYLFFNRGACCSGVNSTYRILMGRSTSPTGPFYDKDSIKTDEGGGSVFLHSDGRIIGPGHFGYNLGILSYHYYDGKANGNSLMRTGHIESGEDNWPLAVYTRASSLDDGTYVLFNKNSNKVAHCANKNIVAGTNVEQTTLRSDDTTQHWVLTNIGEGYYKISPFQAPGMALEVVNSSTSNGGNIQIGEYEAKKSQQWFIECIGNSLYRVVSRNSFLYMEVYYALTTDGANIQQYKLNKETCQQWKIILQSQVTYTGINSNEEYNFEIVPNPSDGNFTINLNEDVTNRPVNIEIYKMDGRLTYHNDYTCNTSIKLTNQLEKGIYIAKVTIGDIVMTQKLLVE
jgi:arabinan endo-1,5-alpha-L-arabinosidase